MTRLFECDLCFVMFDDAITGIGTLGLCSNELVLVVLIYARNAFLTCFMCGPAGGRAWSRRAEPAGEQEVQEM